MLWYVSELCSFFFFLWLSPLYVYATLCLSIYPSHIFLPPLKILDVEESETV